MEPLVTITQHEPDELTGKVTLVSFLTTCAFGLSVLQYCITTADEVLRTIPIIVFCLAAFVYFMKASRTARGAAIGSVFYLPVLIFSVLAAVMPIVSTVFTADDRATMYGVMMIAVLVSARVLVSTMGLVGILRSFYMALAVTFPFVVLISLDQLLASIGAGVRYSPFGFHPNGIALFAAFLVPLHIWLGPPSAKWRMFRLSSIVLCIAVLIATASRSSMVALGTSCGVAYALQSLSSKRRVFKPAYIAVFLLVVFSLIMLLVVDSHGVAGLTSYLWNKFALGTQDRGLNSGMSGRTTAWEEFSYSLAKSLSLFGNGYRTSGQIGYAVDNGYLTVASELGVIPLCVIVGRYTWNLVRAIRTYFRRETSCKMCLSMYICLIFTFLLISTVGRLLFSFGDPINLFALCFLIATDFDFKAFNAKTSQLSYQPA